MYQTIKLCIVVALMCLTVNAESQIKVDLKKKLEQQVNRRPNQKADQSRYKTLDAVEDSITTNPDKKGSTNNNASANKSSTEQTQGTDGQKTGEASQGQQQASLQTYSKYDFVPGEKVIFYDDFSQDAVGDFPELWNTNGSAEVVTTNLFPGKWMKFIMNECVWTDELLKLPGVGRKTANCVLGAAFDVPGIVVDTHVKRLSGRMGFSEDTDPDKIELDLQRLFPSEKWRRFSDILIYHGREICSARKPDHERCPVRDLCPGASS